jgi:hypothetical protein
MANEAAHLMGCCGTRFGPRKKFAYSEPTGGSAMIWCGRPGDPSSACRKPSPR